MSFIKSLKTIWEWVLSIFTFSIPFWIILVTVIIIFIVKRIIRYIPESKPDFLNYTSDVIEGIKCEWSFNTYGGQLSFYGNTPVPVCNNCDGFLVLDSSDYYILQLKCEHCSYKKQISDFSEFQDKIKREIIRRIRTNTWENNSIRR